MPAHCDIRNAHRVEGRFAPGHLGELTQIVPFEMVDAALEETHTVEKRRRCVPSRVVVYLLLAGCLFPEVGYSGVWRKLTAALGRVPVARPTAGALAQARRRVGPAPLRWLFDLLRGPVGADPNRAGVWFKGHLVAAIDGTILTVADEPAVRTGYTKHAGNHFRDRLSAGQTVDSGRVRHSGGHRCGVRADHDRRDHPGPTTGGQHGGADARAG